MSSQSIWSNAPKSVKQAPESSVSAIKATQSKPHTAHTVQTAQPIQAVQTKNYPAIIPAGQKCKHGKWQPEPLETIHAKVWTCYECTFVCSKCGQNTTGICDSYECY